MTTPPARKRATATGQALSPNLFCTVCQRRLDPVSRIQPSLAGLSSGGGRNASTGCVPSRSASLAQTRPRRSRGTVLSPSSPSRGMVKPAIPSGSPARGMGIRPNTSPISSGRWTDCGRRPSATGATCLKPSGGEVDAFAERVVAPDPCRLVVGVGCGGVHEPDEFAEVVGGVGEDRVLACAQDGDLLLFGDLAEAGQHFAQVHVPETVAQLVEDQHPSGGLVICDESCQDELYGEDFHLSAVGGLPV